MQPRNKAFFKMVLALKNTEGPCIAWPYGTNGKYGIVTFATNKVYVHRLVCELAHGLPPTNRHQCAHSCHNKLCCRPSHLRWATAAENQQDETNTNNGHYKLTQEEITEIRTSKLRQKDIAKKFKVSRTHVWRITSGRVWK